MSEKSESTTSNQLISSQGDSPARIFQWQENRPGLTEPGPVYGQSSIALLANYDPDSQLLKTCQTSLLSMTGDHSQESLPILPKSGMMLNGRLYQQTILVRHTSEKESGLWPTPDQRGFTNDGSLEMLASKVVGKAEFQGMAYRAGAKKKEAKYPTPTNSMMTTADMEQARKSGDDPKRPTYQEAKKLWRSPGAALINPNSRVKKLTGRTPQDPQVGLADQVGGQLNPTWVEWLMGYPEGWTDLRDSGTQLSLK